MLTMDQVQDLLSREGTVVGQDGNKIGKVGQIYLDDQTDKPEWATVKTGMFGGGESFVPLAQASLAGDELQVPFDKDKVKDAPRVEGHEGHLSPDDEDELYRYYGMDHSESSSDSGLPVGGAPTGKDKEGKGAKGDRGAVGRDSSGQSTDDAMTRSEEQLNVGTERREGGKARLRKHVVTENVTDQEQVSGQVRKEKVEADTPGSQSGERRQSSTDQG